MDCAIFRDENLERKNQKGIGVLLPQNSPTQRALDWRVRAAFSSVFVASSWFRQNGVTPPLPPASNASRWAAKS
jgi:hypothetical protein